MASNNEWVYFEEVYCVRETDKALIVEIDGEEQVIPKSQISEESDVQELADEGTLVIPKWLAEKKELTYAGTY